MQKEIEMETKAELMVGHYQKTYELTFGLWKERNRLFLILLAVIGVATLLAFRAPGTDSLFVSFVAKALGITDSTRIVELHKTFPFGLLQGILLFVVFYLMVNLHHRALSVLRNYHYLGALEREIRESLCLGESTIAFTREGTFYWQHRGYLRDLVKWIYIVLLGVLLLSFLVAVLVGDVRGKNIPLAVVDAIAAIPTLVFFFAYAWLSLDLDAPGAQQNEPDVESGDKTGS